MDEKAMERDERLARFLISISNWWERQKTKISKFIYLDMLRCEKPQSIVERVQEEVQSWNNKYAGHCEACNHNELKTIHWMDDPRHGFKCFECSRCRHKQPNDNSIAVFFELDKTRVVVMRKGDEPRYALLTNKEQLWVCLTVIAALFTLSFFLFH